jgi:hypothetical protein
VNGELVAVAWRYRVKTPKVRGDGTWRPSYVHLTFDAWLGRWRVHTLCGIQVRREALAVGDAAYDVCADTCSRCWNRPGVGARGTML